jgi:hypothetical protein
MEGFTMPEFITLPDKRICLFCNTRPKAGNDDLCQACAERWLVPTMPRRTRRSYKPRLTKTEEHMTIQARTSSRNDAAVNEPS